MAVLTRKRKSSSSSSSTSSSSSSTITSHISTTKLQHNEKRSKSPRIRLIHTPKSRSQSPFCEKVESSTVITIDLRPLLLAQRRVEGRRC